MLVKRAIYKGNTEHIYSVTFTWINGNISNDESIFEKGDLSLLTPRIDSCNKLVKEWQCSSCVDCAVTLSFVWCLHRGESASHPDQQCWGDDVPVFTHCGWF